MRVLFILHNTFFTHGSNISLIHLIRELYDKGVRIHLAYPDDRIDEMFWERTRGIVSGYHKVKMVPRIFYKNDSLVGKVKKGLRKAGTVNPVRFRSEIADLSRVVEDIKPDIIHTNVGVIHAGFFTARKYHIPHVWHLREYQINDFGYEIYPSKEKFISYLKESYVIAITKDILKFFDLSDYDKASCIYNGCFPADEVSAILPKKKFFLCCSRISREKGYEEIIRAFSILHAGMPEYRLVIAGFGNENYIAYLKKLASELRCPDAVEFVGYQSDIREYMDHAISLLVASPFEAFGRMTAEAAFRGCVVIGKNTGGTREILNETGGFLYSGGYEELAEKMKEVTELTPMQYSERMKRAQNRAVALFSDEASAERVYDLYCRIIDSNFSE